MPSFTFFVLIAVLCAGLVVDAFQLQRSALHQIRLPTNSNSRLFVVEIEDEMPEFQEQPNGSGMTDKKISDNMRDRLLRENASFGKFHGEE